MTIQTSGALCLFALHWIFLGGASITGVGCFHFTLRRTRTLILVTLLYLMGDPEQ